MLFLASWRLLHVLKFAIDDNESRVRVLTLIEVALRIVVEHHSVHLLLCKGILI